MVNKKRKSLAKWKNKPLELVSIDICGPFPASLRGHRYWAELIDSATRRKWVLLLKTRDEIKEKLTIWRKRVELEKSSQGYKIKAVRSDNAGEIKSIVDNWAVTDGVKSESTAPYSSHQNGAAERTFRTTEECMRAKLEDAKMPIEFWDEAVEATVYERNHIDLGPPTKKGKRQCVL
ncbi:hypothetical protein K3495_g17235, partial [Podosphaera aphanis]